MGHFYGVFCWVRDKQAVRYGMSDVFSRRDPLKITDVVIELVPIDVVYVLFAFDSRQERFGHKSMCTLVFSFLVSIQAICDVSAF